MNVHKLRKSRRKCKYKKIKWISISKNLRKKRFTRKCKQPIASSVKLQINYHSLEFKTSLLIVQFLFLIKILKESAMWSTLDLV